MGSGQASFKEGCADRQSNTQRIKSGEASWQDFHRSDR